MVILVYVSIWLAAAFALAFAVGRYFKWVVKCEVVTPDTTALRPQRQGRHTRSQPTKDGGGRYLVRLPLRQQQSWRTRKG